MQTIQLYIEGERVDLFKDESVSVTQTIQNVRDIGKVFTDFSKTFSLPASRTNNKIFQHYYNFDIDDGYDARKKVSATIELNNKEFRKGKIKLEGVKLKEGEPHTYKVTFYGNTVNLKDLLGEDNLSSLEWLNNFNTTYNASTVKTALTTGIDKTVNSVTYTDAIVAPLITHTTRLFYNSTYTNVAYPDANSGNLYPNGTTSPTMHGVYYGDLKYAIPVHLVIKAIEENYSVTFSDDFFTDTNDSYQNLYLWLHRKKGDAFEEDEPITELVDNFTPDTSSMSKVFFTASSFYVFGLTGSQTLSYTLTVNSTTTSPYTVILKKDGQVIDQQSVASGNNVLTGTLSNTSTGYSVFIQTDTAMTVSSVTVAITDPYASQSNTYSTSGSQSITTTRNFIITEQVPKIKVIEFLTGLFKMFNLTAYYDGQTIVVKTLDEYYDSSTTVWDITEYVDNKESNVDILLPFKEIDLKYQGLGTKLALRHEQDNNQGWGTTEYRGGDNYDAGGDVYTVEAPFEHFKYERLIDGATSSATFVQVGWSVDDNNDPYIGRPLLFYPITNSGTTIRFLEDSTSTYSDITAYFIPSNSEALASSTSTKNINYNLEVNEYTLDTGFSGTLFDQYYTGYISEVFNTKVRLTKVKAYLPLKFLLTYSLADRIKILDRKYIINSIQSNLETGLSSLELINVVNYPPPPPETLASVTTNSQSSVTQTSAVFNGQVTDAGNPAYTERGFYWTTGTSTPTASDNVQIVSGTDTNPYSYTNSSLSAGTTYSYVAYATNSVGTQTGTTVSFTTSAALSLPAVQTSGSTSVTQTSATLLGYVTDVGNPDYTVKGFYWVQGTGTPTASDNVETVSGTSSGSYSKSISGLSASTSYSVVAYCTNSQGTATGSKYTFSTAASTYAPSVTTNAASGVGTSSATLNGNITDVGSPNYTEKGFVYMTGSGTPTTSNNKVIVSGTSAGAYSTTVGSLSSSQLYSVRAYAINSVGTSYGSTITFTTSAAVTCDGGTLYFQNHQISGINATLATGSLTYGTGDCGSAISPTLELTFTNNEGEWLSTSQITSLQLYEGATNVTSDYTIGSTLTGDVMKITLSGNYPSASDDGDHTYSFHITATNVDVYQTTITLPTASDVENCSLTVTPNVTATYPASRADFEYNTSTLYPRGETGDDYYYTLTYTADSGYEFTGLGNITSPTVSPSGTGVSASANSYTSTTLTVIISGSIQASDKSATVAYTGSPVAAPATSITQIRYKLSSSSTWTTLTSPRSFEVNENTSYDIEVTANGAYYVSYQNTTLIASVTPTTNNTGDVMEHTVVINNGLVGGGNEIGQFLIYPRGSTTLLAGVRLDFIDT